MKNRNLGILSCFCLFMLIFSTAETTTEIFVKVPGMLNTTPTPTPKLPPMQEYTHPSKAFSISIPVFWEKGEESNGYAYFHDSGTSSIVELASENTIYELDEFDKLIAINNFEKNIFEFRPKYKLAEKGFQIESQQIIITKEFLIENIPFTATTYYKTIGKTIFITTYYAKTGLRNEMKQIFDAMEKSFKSFPAYTEKFLPFTSHMFPYTDPQKMYQIPIPSLWRKDLEQKDGSVNIYYSTGNHAAISMINIETDIVLDAKTAESEAFFQITRGFSDAGLLRTQKREDGCIELAWVSEKKNVYGVSIYNWKDKKFFVVTWVTNKDFYEDYQEVLGYLIDSFIYTVSK